MSVVIAAFNAERFLAETLQSVTAQDHQKMEIIVVDDGSTDCTATIARGFPGVRYFWKRNGGQGSARNLGIHNARGTFLTFVDSDDWWAPEKLKLQMEGLARSGRRWGYADCDYCNQELTRRVRSSGTAFGLPEGDVFHQLLVRNFIPSPTPIVAREVFDKVGLFNEAEKMRNREDWEMWLRIAAEFPVSVVRKVLAKYRVHPASGTQFESARALMEGSLGVLAEMDRRFGHRIADYVDNAIAEVYLRSGLSFLRAASTTEARTCFRRATRAKPTKIRAYLFWLGTFAGGRALLTGRRWRNGFLEWREQAKVR